MRKNHKKCQKNMIVGKLAQKGKIMDGPKKYFSTGKVSFVG
jgi:hypothetical protein